MSIHDQSRPIMAPPGIVHAPLKLVEIVKEKADAVLESFAITRRVRWLHTGNTLVTGLRFLPHEAAAFKHSAKWLSSTKCTHARTGGIPGSAGVSCRGFSRNRTGLCFGGRNGRQRSARLRRGFRRRRPYRGRGVRGFSQPSDPNQQVGYLWCRVPCTSHIHL